MKKNDGGVKENSERIRKQEKNPAIKNTHSRFKTCKSDFSFTSANQLKNSKMIKRESDSVSSQNFFRVTPRMIKILQLLKTVPVLSKAQKILERDSEIPKPSFYRLIKKLELYGFISPIPNTYPKMKKLHPDIKKILSHFSEGISPENEKVRKYEKKGDLIKSQKNDRDLKSNNKVPRDFSPNEKQKEKDRLEKDPTLSHCLISEDFQTSPRDSNGFQKLDDLIIRSHNYFFKIPIQRKPSYLDKLLSKTIWFEKKDMKNWSYFQGKLSMFGCEAIIQFNPNVVTIWLNNIYGRNPHENNLEANRRIMEIKGFLEDSYSGLYLAPAQFIRRVVNTGIEQGWIHHHLALKAKKQNITLKEKNWEIDSSKDMPELEAHNKLLASEHLSKELEDYEYRSEKDIYFRDIHKNQLEHIELINNIQQVQTQLAGGLMTNFQIVDSVLNSIWSFGKKFKMKDQ